MDKRRGTTLLTAVLLMMIMVGCMGKLSVNEQSLENTPVANISNQDWSEEASVDVSEEESTIEPSGVESEAAELSIVIGNNVNLETSLEHITTTFEGTEYRLDPYGVSFSLRTDMGEPVIEDEKVIFSSDLSVDMSGIATISYEVIKNVALNEVVAKELQDHQGLFYGEFIETTSKGGLEGKHNQFKDDSVFSGVFFYEFDRHVLKIEYECPIGAVDAMIRIVNETVDSVNI